MAAARAASVTGSRAGLDGRRAINAIATDSPRGATRWISERKHRSTTAHELITQPTPVAHGSIDMRDAPLSAGGDAVRRLGSRFMSWNWRSLSRSPDDVVAVTERLCTPR